MVAVKLICVGKLKERFYLDACAEYQKRLSAFCRLELEELPEQRKPADPSPAETAAALEREADAILTRVPKGALLTALCVEGEQTDSPGFAEILDKAAGCGGKICFVIGSSDGLAPRVKQAAQLRLSMSKMTFPHHLARVMLLEQIYRGFQILSGGKYHK
jgi:23S rRNA (pseudouridine1915-N3)-methyltransferase